MKDFSYLVSDCVTLITGHSGGLASHLKKNKSTPDLTVLLLPQACMEVQQALFHQKSAMGELCWMTSFVARGVIRGFILAASVQDN